MLKFADRYSTSAKERCKPNARLRDYNNGTASPLLSIGLTEQGTWDNAKAANRF